MILFGIPLRLIKLINKILYSKGGTIKKRLHIVYDLLYETCKDLKIEIIDKNVHSNCFTLRELVSLIKKSNPGIEPKNCYNLLELLKHHSTNYAKFELTTKDRVEIYMAKIKTKESFEVPFIHPTYV
jgi:hypothetical protein